MPYDGCKWFLIDLIDRSSKRSLYTTLPLTDKLDRACRAATVTDWTSIDNYGHSEHSRSTRVNGDFTYHCVIHVFLVNGRVIEL